jgi:hypothetical protein
VRLKSKTVEIYVLIISVTIEALCAIYGGISLMNDPSGESLQLPVSLLEDTFFASYLIPGIILFLLLGFFPLFLIFPLIFKPNWPIINKLNIYKNYHWAWTYTLYTAIMLIIWIDIQVIILRTGSLIQGLFGLFGIFILIVSLTPSVKRFYRLQDRSRNFVKSREDAI